MPDFLTEEVLSEIVAGFFAVLTAVIAIWGAKQKIQLSAANAELGTKREALGLSVDLAKWSVVEQSMRDLEEETIIDRVLVLRCWNGWRAPLYTTAVYQWREKGQAMTQYISVPLDEGYINRVNDMNDQGHHAVDVEAYEKVLPHELIVRIYLSEGVKGSLWFPVASHEVKLPKYWGWLRWFGLKIKAHTYCSFASHTVKDIPIEVFQRCQNISFLMSDAIIR